ncbi:MAG: AsmA family protein, partial [Pseudomonadota bacterium]
AAAASAGGGDADALIIESARVVKGALRFIDRRSGQDLDVADLDLTLALPSLDAAMTLVGSATVNGAAVALDGMLDSPLKAQNGELASAKIDLTADGVAAGFDGRFRAPQDGGAPEAKGALRASLSADRAQTAWLRKALPPSLDDLGAASLTGDIDASDAALDVKIDGDLEVKGQQTKLLASVAAGPGWADGTAPADVDVSAANAALDAGYKGSLSFGALPSAVGDWRFKSADLQQALAWIGMTPEGQLALLSAIDLSGSVDATASKVNGAAAGDMRFNGRTVTLDAEALAEGDWGAGAAPVRKSVTLAGEGGFFNASWSGEATLPQGGGAPSVAGDVAFETGSLREFAEWATSQPVEAPAGALGAFSFKSAVSQSADRVALTEMALALDDVSVAGDVSVEGLEGDRPRVDVDLTSDKPLDLRPFAKMAQGGGGGGGSGSAGGGGGAGGQGWSDEPFDLAVLNLIDARFKVALGGLIVDGLRLGASEMTATLEGGSLSVAMPKLGFYGGALAEPAALEIRGGDAPSYKISMDLSGVALRPMLSDMAGVGNIEGTGAFALDVGGAARSMKSVMSSMGGSASMNLTNGAILGFNLAAITRNITSLGTASGENQKTDFAAITGSFAIENGVATNNDFSFLGPLLRATGRGQIDLGAQTINYRLEPKAVASLKGQGGDATARGITFPILISGPWSNPSITPDLLGGGLPDVEALGSVLEVPTDLLQGLEGGGVEELLQGLGGGDGGGGVGDAIGGVLGGGGDSGGGGVSDVIEGVLGGGDGGGDGGGGVGGVLDGVLGGGDGGGDAAPAEETKP